MRINGIVSNITLKHYSNGSCVILSVDTREDFFNVRCFDSLAEYVYSEISVGDEIEVEGVLNILKRSVEVEGLIVPIDVEMVIATNVELI